MSKGKSVSDNRLVKVLLHILQSMKANSEDYCELTTTADNYSLIFKNGALLTLVEYNGVTDLVDDEQFSNFITRFSSQIGVYLKDSGHQLGMVFSRDIGSDGNLKIIEEIKKETAENLQLDIEDFIEEETEIYSRYVNEEKNYFLLITQPNLLLAQESEQELKRKKDDAKGHEIPLLDHSQNIYIQSDALLIKHEAFIGSLCAILDNNAYPVDWKKLDVVEALREIKMAIDSERTPPEWIPQIPNLNKVPSLQESFVRREVQTPMVYSLTKNPVDVSCVAWQPLSKQLLSVPIYAPNKDPDGLIPNHSVCLADKIYSPIVIDIPPQTQVCFPELFRILNSASTRTADNIERAMPYTISFMLSGDGFAGFAIKQAIAKVLAFASSNRAVQHSFDTLKLHSAQQGTVVKFQASAMTWAEDTPEGRENLHIRRTKLIQSIQKWGGAQIREKTGDPILGFISNLPGITYKHHAPQCAARLDEALALFPLQRPSTIFKNGNSVTCSVDNKLLVQSLFAKECSTWIKLYVGKPGSGKSMAMNHDIYDAVMMPGNKRIPFIFMIDVGITSRGTVNLFRDSLPEHLQHLAVYRQLRNSKADAINIFDCPVGFNKPRAVELSQIVTFLTTLLTAREATSPEQGLSDFLTAVVLETFKKKQDDLEGSTPNLFDPSRCPELTELCNSYKIQCFSDNNIPVSYYHLVRVLHEKAEMLGGDKNIKEVAELYRARDLAHRYAMPILEDAVQVASASSGVLYDNYSTKMTSTNQTFLQLFNQTAQEASSAFPVFTNPTTFDLSTSRICAIDLQTVVDKNNPKQSSLFFQIAAIYAKKQFSFSKEDLADIPQPFYNYYSNFIKEIQEDKKIIAMDELHNASEDEYLFRGLDKDSREGRKWGMMLLLSSQRLEDFKNIPSTATQFVLADAGTASSQAVLMGDVGVSKQAIEVLKRNVGRSDAGLTYLNVTVSKNGSVHSNLTTLTIGAKWIWSLTTDQDDRALKEALLELVGYNRKRATEILAHYFPKSTAKSAIERRKSMSSKATLGIRSQSAISLLAKDIFESSLKDNIGLSR